MARYKADGLQGFEADRSYSNVMPELEINFYFSVGAADVDLVAADTISLAFLPRNYVVIAGTIFVDDILASTSDINVGLYTDQVTPVIIDENCYMEALDASAVGATEVFTGTGNIFLLSRTDRTIITATIVTATTPITGSFYGFFTARYDENAATGTATAAPS